MLTRSIFVGIGVYSQYRNAAARNGENSKGEGSFSFNPIKCRRPDKQFDPGGNEYRQFVPNVRRMGFLPLTKLYVTFKRLIFFLLNKVLNTFYRLIGIMRKLKMSSLVTIQLLPKW